MNDWIGCHKQWDKYVAWLLRLHFPCNSCTYGMRFPAHANVSPLAVDACMWSIYCMTTKCRPVCIRSPAVRRPWMPSSRFEVTQRCTCVSMDLPWMVTWTEREREVGIDLQKRSSWTEEEEEDRGSACGNKGGCLSLFVLNYFILVSICCYLLQSQSHLSFSFVRFPS